MVSQVEVEVCLAEDQEVDQPVLQVEEDQDLFSMNQIMQIIKFILILNII
jgi:hypothetical protein